MKTLGTIVVIALTLFPVSVGIAEEPPEMPQPTDEQKALGTWVGSWSGFGEMKAGPFGPGGPMKWTENCSWFGGVEFNVVCRSKGTAPTGPMKGLGIMGYNPGKKVYTHYGLDNNGWSGYAEGTRSGDTWTYQSTETMEGKTYHSRFTVTMQSPTEMVFSWEMSEDEKNWINLMEGSSKKN